MTAPSVLATVAAVLVLAFARGTRAESSPGCGFRAGALRRRVLGGLAVALGVALAVASRAATLGEPTGLTAAQREKVDAGGVVLLPPRKGDPTVCAAVWVHAAPEAVWRVMVDCPRAPEFVPGMRGCRVLEQQGDVALIEHRVKVLALLPELTYVFHVEHRPHRRIRFRRVAGALRTMEGEWRLEPHRDGTLVTYAVVLDPGFAIPRWAVRRALGRDLPGLLSALKQRVEESADERLRAGAQDE